VELQAFLGLCSALAKADVISENGIQNFCVVFTFVFFLSKSVFLRSLWNKCSIVMKQKNVFSLKMGKIIVKMPKMLREVKGVIW